MNAEHWKNFIDSLEGENGLPEEMHGFNLHTPVERLRRNNDLNKDSFKGDKNVMHFCDLVDVLLLRIEHLESRQIPDLKERVKKFVDAAMEAEGRFWRSSKAAYIDAERGLFRALCAPEVKP